VWADWAIGPLDAFEEEPRGFFVAELFGDAAERQRLGYNFSRHRLRSASCTNEPDSIPFCQAYGKAEANTARNLEIA
jgi:hypothetical protein